MHYPWRRRRAGGWLEQPSSACLFPAITVEMKAKVFLKAREKSDYGIQCVGCAHGYYLWARLRRWIGQWKKKCLDHGSDWKMESRLQRRNSDREESTVWSQNPRGKEMEDQSGRRSFRVNLLKQALVLLVTCPMLFCWVLTLLWVLKLGLGGWEADSWVL